LAFDLASTANRHTSDRHRPSWCLYLILTLIVAAVVIADRI
jgi:hypothetical protein